MAPSAGAAIAAAKSRWNSSSKGEAPAENFLGALTLGHQLGEWRNVAIALDQRRRGADAGDEFFVEMPDLVADGRVVAVDQQRTLVVEAMACEMDFAHELCRDRFEPGRGVVAEIVRTDYDIADVDQQLAAS